MGNNKAGKYTLTVLQDHILNYLYCIVKCSACNKRSLISLGALYSRFVPCPECNEKLSFGFEGQTLNDFGKALDGVDEQLKKADLTLMFLHKPHTMIKFQGKRA